MCLKDKRKKWPNKLIQLVFDRPENPYGRGFCWHCGKKIHIDKRNFSDGTGAWHIDHYPIPYVDIKDQLCCGVTDQHQLSNLVPACIECNISHKYEKKYRIFCNRSQICCQSKYMIIILMFSLILGSYFAEELYNILIKKKECDLVLVKGISIPGTLLNYIGIDSCSTNSPYLDFTYLDYFFSYVYQVYS